MIVNEKTEPKFKVGQVVAIKSIRKEPPFRILGMMWNDGWYYQWNSKNYASEEMVRELTPEEKG